MSIRFIFFGKCYVLDIGRKTPWFEQVYLFSLTREYYVVPNDMEVSYAKLIFGFGSNLKGE